MEKGKQKFDLIHEPSRVVAKRAGGRTLLGAGRDGLWRSGHGPSGQDPKDEKQKEDG